MSKSQKIIKYFALALAFFLIINIFLGITYAVKTIYYIFNDKPSTSLKLESLNIDDIKNKSITSLEIDIDSFDLSIQRGATLKIETNNDKVKVSEKLGKLIIEEKINNWFLNNNDKLVITIPESLNLNELSLNTGAGQVNINDLTIDNLYLNLGAGKVEINNLNVLTKTKIDGGAGKIDIDNSSINNLDLDIGVGNVQLTSKILGNSEINAGVGSLNVTLLGNLNDYKVTAEKGIGTFTISNIKIKDEETFGNGNNKIEIEGGIGEINVRFQK